MAEFDNERLFEIYTKSDFERDAEVEEIEKAVRNVVDQIGQLIGEEDPLFRNRILTSGSFYENLKVEKPDEFDFMVCLEDLSAPGLCRIVDIPRRKVKDPGYVLVRLNDAAASERWSAYISKNKNLKSKDMLDRFCVLVERVCKKVDLHPKLTFHGHDYVELRKIPVTLKLMWSGEKYKFLEIPVDMPLCIYVDGWPESCKLYYTRSHPGYDFLNQAKSRGYHLVASCIGESGVPRPCWRLSFSIAEGILLRNIFKNSSPVYRATVMALKVLRKNNEGQLALLEQEFDVDSLHVSLVVSWVFHSYVIKTTFLQEWFEHPEDEYWMEDKLTERVRAILGRMKAGLERKDIRSFWVEDYKLFNFKARNTPVTDKCLQKLTDMVKSIEV